MSHNLFIQSFLSGLRWQSRRQAAGVVAVKLVVSSLGCSIVGMLIGTHPGAAQAADVEQPASEPVSESISEPVSELNQQSLVAPEAEPTAEASASNEAAVDASLESAEPELTESIPEPADELAPEAASAPVADPDPTSDSSGADAQITENLEDDAAEQTADAASPRVEDSAAVPTLDVRSGSRKQNLFGTYRVRLSLAQPRFDDGAKFYEKLYGRESLFPTIAADWFAFDWYATLGLSMRLGYYTDNGHTAKDVPGKDRADLEDSDIVKNNSSPTSLTFIPLQLALAAQITPFDRKWLVIDGWIGLERAYWQEVRTGSTAETQAMLTANAEAAGGEDLTNRGYKTATTIGVSANILLNPLDEQSAASMRGSMGLGSVYLSPFLEIVRTLDKSGVSFGRSLYGIGFTFESLR